MGESETEDIDMDYYVDCGMDLVTVYWNLEDYPIPENVELGSICPRIKRALTIMGFHGSKDIQGYFDDPRNTTYIDALCEAGIGCCPSFRSVADMPERMIVHALSSSSHRARVAIFVIADQTPGSELHRVQQCLKSRNYTVIVVDDPSKQRLFQSPESLVDCTRFFGAHQPVSRGRRSFYTGENPLSRSRYEELRVELYDAFASGSEGGYTDAYKHHVSRLCEIIALRPKVTLDDISTRIDYICPIDHDICRVVKKVLLERGFRFNFYPEEDNAKESPFNSVESSSPALVQPPDTCDSHSDTCDSHSDPISQFDISKIEDFSEPITPVDTAVFWDVVDCPFPLSSKPDEIYSTLGNALRARDWEGETKIWAYVDENNGPWHGEHLRHKTWSSKIYFLPGGDKASRRRRMLNDILLWKMDKLSPINHTATADDVIVVSYQVREDPQFLLTLEYMSFFCLHAYLVTPTQHANEPESRNWPALLLNEANLMDPRSKSSEPSPEKA